MFYSLPVLATAITPLATIACNKEDNNSKARRKIQWFKEKYGKFPGSKEYIDAFSSGYDELTKNGAEQLTDEQLEQFINYIGRIAVYSDQALH
ncbi:hypothetical protein [Mycoplasma sp. HS2188]|uniref:hypothetical protein n=1 Tax=Mycoplasma sp. HS2188 TaxID=2976765 RepID=UPI0021A99C01|nr:hypothetical protein [Mycoplasma sp. HS2188]MCT4469709.1 hypothetical protein [Mycoplasma sp. HS2188]